jgi:hypothetical protein
LLQIFDVEGLIVDDQDLCSFVHCLTSQPPGDFSESQPFYTSLPGVSNLFGQNPQQAEESKLLSASL